MIGLIVFQPAIHAVAAVRDQLYASAGEVVPREFQGDTARVCNRLETPGCVRYSRAIKWEHFRRPWDQENSGPEKDTSRERAVLAELVRWASRPESFSFRDADKELEKTAKMLLFQVSEMH